ncbi:MAG: carbon-nitrogen hydrolase family protein [Treponemataceae bacterium]|nr:carbon-nitrogen hydrolase family protein [Treponemataceae bacterium]
MNLPLKNYEILKIALLQIMPAGSLQGNLEKGLDACVRAKKMGADIALFPEMWSCGYSIPEDICELKQLSISENSDFVCYFQNLAKNLKIAIGITFLETSEPLPKNTIMLFDRHGKLALKYSKVHTCDFGEEARLSAGDDFYVADIETGIGIVKIGSMICFDREFPESARILMVKGAEVVLAPNACPMEINRLAALRTRAYENMIAITTCNYPAGHPDCNGHSSVFDGVAWLKDEEGSRDMCVLNAPGGEGIYIGKIDMKMLREYRATEVMGNAYRHPGKYKIITECGIEEPFVRADYRN